MSDLEKAKEFFKGDIYATVQTGITIESVDGETAVCSFETKEHHKNAGGFVMGGAIYTLADFTFAVAANASGVHTVTLDGSIRYLAPGSGEKITAVAKPIKQGKTVCVYEVTVNDSQKDIAYCVFSGYRTKK